MDNAVSVTELAEAAIHQRWTDVVRLAISGCDTNTVTKYGTPLSLAAQAGRDDVVRALLRCGANPNLIPHGRNAPLFDVSLLGLASIAEQLIAGGASVDATSHDGMTALMATVANDHRGVAQVLLRHGADPNVRAHDGTTALRLTQRRVHYLPKIGRNSWPIAVGHLTALDKDNEMVRLLLEAGANPSD